MEGPLTEHRVGNSCHLKNGQTNETREGVFRICEGLKRFWIYMRENETVVTLTGNKQLCGPTRVNAFSHAH